MDRAEREVIRARANVVNKWACKENPNGILVDYYEYIDFIDNAKKDIPALLDALEVEIAKTDYASRFYEDALKTWREIFELTVADLGRWKSRAEKAESDLKTISLHKNCEI